VKYCILFSALIISQNSFCQVDTSYLKSVYDRSLDFAEDKLDSINYYADLIAKESVRLHFNKEMFYHFAWKEFMKSSVMTMKKHWAIISSHWMLQEA